MKVVAVFGGPGTGKTTWLSKKFAEECARVGRDKVAFVSYTRRQIRRDRAEAKKAAGITEKISNFSTLHALSRQSYQGGTTVIGKGEIESMSVYLGKDMTGVARGIDYMRNVLSECEAVGANRAGMEAAEFQRYKRFYEKVKEGKSAKGEMAIDFADMLSDAVNSRFKVDCEVAFVDECQDLSPLQWRAVLTFFSGAETLYLAGDPNQALYRFSGGAADYMLEMRCDKIITLPKSYRCPEPVSLMAERVAMRMRSPAPLPAPCEREGSFAVFYPDSNVKRRFLKKLLGEIRKGRSVLVLANTYYQLKGMRDRLIGDSNIPHNFFSGRHMQVMRRKGKCLVFSTVHQAKGLEADYVLYDASSGQSAMRNDFGRQEEKLDDYYKVVYTGITRARIGVIVCEMSKARLGEPSCLDALYYAKYGFEEYKRWLTAS